jgi:hypothetical protein
MGGAYGALAADAYAPVYNPAGLGFSPAAEIAGQHLSYLESIHFEYLSMIHPLGPGRGVGASLQYLGSGDITQTSDSGQETGQFSNHYAAYTLAYGQKLTEKLALGVAGKWVNAKLSDVSANAYAGDAGFMLRATDKLSLAGTVSNAGSKLTFLNDGGSLPLAGRLSVAYQAAPQLRVATDAVYQAYGLASGHVGLEWRPVPMVALRAGYRTDTTKELGAAAGITAGMGLMLWGQEFSYAWLPMGELGNAQYFSLLLRFGEKGLDRKNLIQYHSIRAVQSARSGGYIDEEIKDPDPEYQELIRLIERTDPSVVTAENP